MRHRKYFRKSVHGFMEVNAKSKEHAEQQFEDGEYEEYDNKSDYDYQEWGEVRE